MEELWAPARGFLERLLAVRLRHPFLIRLCNADEFAKAYGKDPRVADGRRVIGFFQSIGDDYAIVVESGRSRENVLETLIHEFGHALVRTYGFTLSREESEGFSRWLEYRYLMVHGGDAQAGRLLDDPSVYGTGLRLMLERERSLGHRLTFRKLLRRESGSEDGPGAE